MIQLVLVQLAIDLIENSLVDVCFDPFVEIAVVFLGGLSWQFIVSLNPWDGSQTSA